MILDRIQGPNDIKKIPLEEWEPLAEEIRQFIIERVAENGGHLASNLGAVELTLALHLVCDLLQDKIIWDGGHQSYTHKILTGRKDAFARLRQYGGLSGFPKRQESPCDAFDTGHSSTAISAGLGYAEARELLGENQTIISVLGDGALTGGMSYEALNNASRMKSNFIIVLNDNNMSISENVGGLSAHLSNIRTKPAYQNLKSGVAYTLGQIPLVGDQMVRHIRKTKDGLKQLIIPGMIFENLGITYLGPVDGHNIKEMVRILRDAKQVEGAVVVHVFTEKGKGYGPAQRHPARFHGTDAFDIATGIPLYPRKEASYTDIFSTVMRKLGEREERLVAITAAMSDGTGLKRFRNRFPERFFDVGIAEEHAVTFAAGLAAAGLRPVVAVYSSFLQRAYDQVVHDVCMQDLPVIFAIDRAGLVGNDGPTHHGSFDLSYLSTIPNLTIMAPKNKWELSDMLKFALTYPHPVAIRYPRGVAYTGLEAFRAPMEPGKSEWIVREKEIALLAVGSMIPVAEQVQENLKKAGHSCSLINVRFVKPLDKELLRELPQSHSLIVTLEDNVKSGGFGEHVGAFYQEEGMEVSVQCVALPDAFVEQGTISVLRENLGMDAESVTERILQKLLR